MMDWLVWPVSYFSGNLLSEARIILLKARLFLLEARLVSIEPELFSLEPRLISPKPRLISPEPRLVSLKPGSFSLEARLASDPGPIIPVWLKTGFEDTSFVSIQLLSQIIPNDAAFVATQWLLGFCIPA